MFTITTIDCENCKKCVRQLYIIEKHMYCLDCLQQCEKCLVYILKSHNNKYCNQCEMITKVNLVRNTNNDITYKLPIELVDMIISCFKKLNLK